MNKASSPALCYSSASIFTSAPDSKMAIWRYSSESRWGISNRARTGMLIPCLNLPPFTALIYIQYMGDPLQWFRYWGESSAVQSVVFWARKYPAN